MYMISSVANLVKKILP